MTASNSNSSSDGNGNIAVATARARAALALALATASAPWWRVNCGVTAAYGSLAVSISLRMRKNAQSEARKK